MTGMTIARFAAVLLLVAASTVFASGERVTFELPDMNGKTVRSADLESRYTLLVYQGMP